MTPTSAAPVQSKAPPASAEDRRSVSTAKRAKDPFSQIFDQKMSQKVEKESEGSELKDDKVISREARPKGESTDVSDQAGENGVSSQMAMMLAAQLPETGLIKINSDSLGLRGSSDFEEGKAEESSTAASEVAEVKPEIVAPVKAEASRVTGELPAKESKVANLGIAGELPAKESKVAKLGTSESLKAIKPQEPRLQVGQPALLEMTDELEMPDSTVKPIEPGQFLVKKEMSAPLLVSKEELVTQELAADSATGEGSKPNWMLESQQGGEGAMPGREEGSNRLGGDGMEAAKSVGDMKFWSDKGLENTIEPAFPADHGHSIPEQAQRGQVEPVALRVGSIEPSNVVAPGTVQGVSHGESHVESNATTTLPRELQPVLEEMWETVTNFQIRSATRMVVQIRPDDATRLKLVVQQNKGRVEIQAEIQRGDSQVMSAGWTELQATLAEKGVVLRPLEVSQIFQSTANDPANLLMNDSGRKGGSANESEPEHLDWEDRTATRPATIPTGRFQPTPALSGVWERWA